jgi:E3 ubiquitin-protein ligase RAD18
MTVQAVEAHIDHCDGEPPSKKKGARNSTQNPTIHKAIKRPERLPHPHYSGLKDAALRKKLADQGISSSGSRQLMERRYTEWVTLWNANCDSKNPKGKSELRRDLDLWERTQGGRAVVSWKEQEIGSQIRDKDFDGKAWAEKNDEAFKQLIANARRKPAAKASSSGSGPAQGEAVDGPSVALRTLDRPHTEMVPRPSFDPSIQTSSLPQSGSTVSNEQPRATTSPVTYKGSQTRAFQEPSSPGHTGPLPSPQRQGTSTLDKDTAINPDRTTIKPLEP